MNLNEYYETPTQGDFAKMKPYFERERQLILGPRYSRFRTLRIILQTFPSIALIVLYKVLMSCSKEGLVYFTSVSTSDVFKLIMLRLVTAKSLGF